MKCIHNLRPGSVETILRVDHANLAQPYECHIAPEERGTEGGEEVGFHAGVLSNDRCKRLRVQTEAFECFEPVDFTARQHGKLVPALYSRYNVPRPASAGRTPNESPQRAA